MESVFLQKLKLESNSYFDKSLTSKERQEATSLDIFLNKAVSKFQDSPLVNPTSVGRTGVSRNVRSFYQATIYGSSPKGFKFSVVIEHDGNSRFVMVNYNLLNAFPVPLENPESLLAFFEKDAANAGTD